MKIITILSAFVAAFIMACTPLQAADTGTDSAMKQSSKHSFQGTIMAMDMSANTVTVQTSHGAMTMTINADTKFRVEARRSATSRSETKSQDHS